MYPEANNHHLWWERKSYTTPSLKKLRNMSGFVIRASAYDHRLLHAQMRPMVVPPKPLADAIIDYASSVDLTDRFAVANATIGFLHQQHEQQTSDELAYRSQRLAFHLEKQIGYLSLHGEPARRAA